VIIETLADARVFFLPFQSEESMMSILRLRKLINYRAVAAPEWVYPPSWQLPTMPPLLQAPHTKLFQVSCQTPNNAASRNIGEITIVLLTLDLQTAYYSIVTPVT
jgi:hypothetical protein